MDDLRATFDLQKKACAAAPEVPWAQRADRLTRLKALTPSTYVGKAAELAKRIIGEDDAALRFAVPRAESPPPWRESSV